LSIGGITKSKVAIFYTSWWLLLVVLETYALTSTYNLSLKAALIDAIDTNLLIATAGYIVYNGLNYYRPSLQNASYLVIWSVVMAILCVVIHKFLMMGFYMVLADEPYQAFLQNSHIMRGLFCWLMIVLIAIMSYTWYYMKDQQASEKREQDAIKLARETELATLRQQLQPHFLFNSLNSISALAGAKPEEARKMIQQLSDFLRGTIRRDDHQMVSLEEELRHLQLYLDIEKVRFGHRLKTEVFTTPETSALQLPSLLLQPIVENAIKFGLYDTTGDITISIKADTVDQELQIKVENPFDPETASPRQGTGFGLQSVQRRLHLLFARQDLVSTSQHENIFITTVKIPQSL
jgi:two-component system, LytTR family, sensor kinase